MNSISIKKKEDLVNIFGLKVTNLIAKEMRKTFMKRMPFSVSITNTKPSFHLNDGGMLRAYAVDLSSGKILSDKYCGSADSAMMHTKEQFGEGQKAPGELAVFFVETYPNSGNHSWTLTVVSNYLTPQIQASAQQG